MGARICGVGSFEISLINLYADQRRDRRPYFNLIRIILGRQSAAGLP